MRKPAMWFPNRSDTNWSVLPQKKVRLKFWIKKGEGLYYLCSENKGTDQLCSYCILLQSLSAPLVSNMQTVGFLMWRLLSF